MFKLCSAVLFNSKLSDMFFGSCQAIMMGPIVDFIGVGHQTAKRLQALGLVSVKDLQLFPLNDLVREFGGTIAQRLKNLAFGVDDAPVTQTGAPQVGWNLKKFLLFMSGMCPFK